MIQLKDKSYDEEELQKLLFDEKISVLDYCMHRSEKKKQQFITFCRKRGMAQDDDSASAFLKYELEKIEDSHIEGLD